MSNSIKSFGRKSIRVSAVPQDLMGPSQILAKAWHAQVVTLMPDAFPGILGDSLTGKALRDGIWQLGVTSLREFGEGKHRKVDDVPAGGGAGLVIRPDILADALDHARAQAPKAAPIVYLSPKGRPFRQADARAWAQKPGIILICGRFEGIDARLTEEYPIDEISIGDFVMTGGELAAMALIDASVRLIPRVLGNAASIKEESFSEDLLEHPQYTKPAIWRGHEIPEVLRSGHHGKAAKWRRVMAERLTKERRPDLWRAYCGKHGRDPNEDPEL